MPNSLADFAARVTGSWLPTFCNDPGRKLSAEGFQASSISVSEVDALGCMHAIDCGLIVDHGGGRYRAARNTAFEQLFWTGPRDSVPRRLTLWHEPVITFAALSRLHRDHGWPSHLLGTQPRAWAFDLVAHASSDNDAAHILGEVKKTAQEADRLIADLLALSYGSATSTVRKNSARKWNGLLEERPQVLWVVGPSGYSKAMTVEYRGHDRVVLNEAASSALDYAAFHQASAP